MSHLKSKYVKVFSGGDKDKKVAPKKTMPVGNQFSAWGDLGKQAEGEGWYAATAGTDATEYRNKYDNQFNQVVIPNQKEKGYISVVGNNRGGGMTVYIKKADGTIDRTLLQNVTPKQVDDFFRSKTGTIQKRHDSIVAGTNIDRVMPNGTYTPLQ